MAKIGYAKIGRSYSLNPSKATSVGGDADVVNLLMRLATSMPEHEFVLVGKNSGEDPATFGYPPNVINPWTTWKEDWKNASALTTADEFINYVRTIYGDSYKDLDGMIVWAGQHGSANSQIPMIGADWITKPGTDDDDVITGGVAEALATPQAAFIRYVSWLLDYIARWRESKGIDKAEEIWLCPDPRNYLKCREKRNPIRYPVLAQYDFLNYHKAERYGRFPEVLFDYDPTGYREQSRWVSNVAYCYSGLELTAVSAPDEIPFEPGLLSDRHTFGMVVNENQQGGSDSRLKLLKSWVLPSFPNAEIRGHWTESSQIDLKRVINPVPYTEVYDVMKSFATTLTTPASNSGWATAKPWEAFALGSVCFFHPRYDDQGHILPIPGKEDGKEWSEDAKMLGSYLRVKDAKQFVERVDEVTNNPELFYALVTAQRRHYEASYAKWVGGAKAIMDRIEHDLTGAGPEAPWTKMTSVPAATVSNRGAPRPRGTNEERRKKKPPISRRRPIRDGLMDETMATSEPVIEASTQPEQDVKPVAQEETPVTKTYIGTFVPPIGYIGGFSSSPSIAGFSATTTTKPTVNKRQSKDEYFLDIAKKVATQTTCARRAVGCVLVSPRKTMLATGFNGVPKGMPHCNEGHRCPGADAPSGQNLSGCLSAHAEINGLLQCSDVNDIETVYVTVSPCNECIKAIMNTSAKRIVFAEEYNQPEAKARWLSIPGNEWTKL